MAEYKPLFVYLEPASIPQVVAHIQKYLSENPIVSDPEAIAEAIQKYIEEHPEIIAVASVNGKTGNVVLTGSDININASSAVSIETQLLNLASMINNVGADITQIESNITQIYTDIGTLQTNVETNASNISALQTSVEGQGTRLATAETDIDNLETAQTAQGTRLNSAEGNISSLQTRMTQAETDIDSNENAIATNQTAIQALESDIPKLGSERGLSASSFKGIGGRVRKWGLVCMISFDTGKLNAAVSADATVGTLPDGFRPISQVQVLNTYTTAQERWLITVEGYLKPTVDLASNTGVRFTAVYITDS